VTPASPNLLAAFSGRRPAAPAWFTKALATAPERNRVNVQNANIEMLTWGRRGAPGLLLLHGLGAHADWWSHIAPFFASRHRVAALSWSGMGGSDWRAHYTLDAYLDEFLSVAQAGGLFEAAEAPLAVGHSFGGLLLLAAAATYGDRLKGAVILDSYLQPEGGYYLPDLSSPQPASAASTQRPMPVYPTLEAALARFRFAPPQACDNLFIADQIARASIRRVDSAASAAGFTWRFDPRTATDRPRMAISEYLAKPRCPLAFVVGGRSPLTGAAVKQFVMSTASRAAPWIEIPDADHHVLVDQPLALAAALNALFECWPAPRSAPAA
jgi:pimeloyl-ACP methyl ester carboxylesterase